jgi:hypothetical protein
MFVFQFISFYLFLRFLYFAPGLYFLRVLVFELKKCVCVCVCVRERERERESNKKNKREEKEVSLSDLVGKKWQTWCQIVPLNYRNTIEVFLIFHIA